MCNNLCRQDEQCQAGEEIQCCVAAVGGGQQGGNSAVPAMQSSGIVQERQRSPKNVILDLS